MSGESNEKSSQQNKSIGEIKEPDIANSKSCEEKSLTFNDWKILKESESKHSDKSEGVGNTKVKNLSKTNSVNNRNINESFDGCQGSSYRGSHNFVPRNNGNVPGFVVSNNFNRINNFGRVNSCGFNGPSQFGFNDNNCYNNGYYIQKGFTSNSSNSGNHYINARNLPDSFFASDGIYRQKDLMQKPLQNLFRNEKAKGSLEGPENVRFKKDGRKMKKDAGNIQGNKKKTQSTNNKSTLEETNRLGEEPKVYVYNPNSNKDGKVYIAKPKIPEENLQITKEEKKRQWKEYREAMKPFKNREFYNAKRVVQRLGKKDVSELNEKELFRLTNAREVMAAHKARLSAKYPNYVKADDKSNELGEVYILKKAPIKDWTVSKAIPKELENYGNFGENRRIINIEPSRIMGGPESFEGFVPGGSFESIAQNIYQN